MYRFVLIKVVEFFFLFLFLFLLGVVVIVVVATHLAFLFLVAAEVLVFLFLDSVVVAVAVIVTLVVVVVVDVVGVVVGLVEPCLLVFLVLFIDLRCIAHNSFRNPMKFSIPRVTSSFSSDCLDFRFLTLRLWLGFEPLFGGLV